MPGWKAPNLLRRAREVYDDPACPLRLLARDAWRGGFASGGRWMQQALAHLRGLPAPVPPAGLNRLGALKYGLACAAALLVVAPAIGLRCWPLMALAVAAFYAVEAQMVFLFPLLLDGSARPFRDSRLWTVRAGGTLRVMAVVGPVAVVMLGGGFAGRGFVRSWCLGCLAVCLWYEDLRASFRVEVP